MTFIEIYFYGINFSCVHIVELVQEIQFFLTNGFYNAEHTKNLVESEPVPFSYKPLATAVLFILLDS